MYIAHTVKHSHDSYSAGSDAVKDHVVTHRVASEVLAEVKFTTASDSRRSAQRAKCVVN